MAQFARVTALGWRQGDDATAQARVGGSGWYQVGAVVADTTAPTLTSVSGTDTGSTSATVSVSSTEAGPGWVVLTGSATKPSQAQVEAGQDHTGAAAAGVDTATLAIGSNPAAFVITGLTAGATYFPHVVAKDTATPTANVSLVESGASFTMPSPDLTDPVWPGGTTLGFTAKTNNSVALTASADATDNVAVAGYEWSSDNGATYPFTSLTRSFTFTALADLTSYNFRVRPYDPSGRRGAHLSLTTSTYRAGDTAANVIANTAPVGGNPAGHMHALALTQASSTWMSYRTISGPTPGGGTLTQFPNGNFTYFGASGAIWTTQAELNGVDHTETTIINLYDQTVRVETSQPGAWSVRNLVSVTQAAAFSVRNLVATAQAGAWTVRNLVAATQSGAWSVRNLVAASQDGAWSVSSVALASATQAGAWSVRNYVAASQPGAWSVDGIVYTSAPSGSGFNPLRQNKIRPPRIP